MRGIMVITALLLLGIAVSAQERIAMLTVSTPHSRGGRDGVGWYRRRPQFAVRRRSLRIYPDRGSSATWWWGRC